VGLYEATSGHNLAKVEYSSTYRPSLVAGGAASSSCGTCCVKASAEQLFVPYRALLPEGATCLEYVDDGVCVRATQTLFVLGKRGDSVMLNWQTVTASGSGLIRVGGLPKVHLGDSNHMTLGGSSVADWNSSVASWMLLGRAGTSQLAPLVISYPVTVGQHFPALAKTDLDVISAEVLAFDTEGLHEIWRLRTVQPKVVAVLGNIVSSAQGAVHIPVLLNVTTSRTATQGTVLQVRVLKLKSSNGEVLWRSDPLASMLLRNGSLFEAEGTSRRSLPAFVAALHPSALLVCQQGRLYNRAIELQLEEDIGIASLAHASGRQQWGLQTFTAQLQYDPSAPNGISTLSNAPAGHGVAVPLPVRCAGAMIADDVRLYAPIIANLPLNLSDVKHSQTTVALAVLSQTIIVPSINPWVHFVSSLNRTAQADSLDGAFHVQRPISVSTKQLKQSQSGLVPQFLQLIISSRGRIALELNLASTFDSKTVRTRAEQVLNKAIPDDDLPFERQNAGVEVTAIGCKPNGVNLWTFLSPSELLHLVVGLFLIRLLLQGTWAFTFPIKPASSESMGQRHSTTSSSRSQNQIKLQPWWVQMDYSSNVSNKIDATMDGGVATSESGQVDHFLLGSIGCCDCPIVRDRQGAATATHLGITRAGQAAEPASRSPGFDESEFDHAAASEPSDGLSDDDGGDQDAFISHQKSADWRATTSRVLDDEYAGWSAASQVCTRSLCPCLQTQSSRRQAYRSSAISAIAQAQRTNVRRRSMGQMLKSVHCGLNVQCVKAWCKFSRLSPSQVAPQSGCRCGRFSCSSSPKWGSAVPWLLLTFANVLIAAALVTWSASEALDSIHQLIDKIEQPTSFYREYIIDREPTEDFGCASPTLAACYCEGNVDGAIMPAWDQDRLVANSACQAPPNSNMLSTCTLACTATLRNTGNCASSVFLYSCECGSVQQRFQDTALFINASLNSASMRTPGLIAGLANCRAHYFALSSSIIACTALFVVICVLAILGALWMRVGWCSQLGSRKHEQTGNSFLDLFLQPRSISSWFQYVAALYTIGAVLFIFWQLLLTQSGRVCTGADGDQSGSQLPHASENLKPSDSYILQHVTGCALGAGWHNEDLEGVILRRVRQAWVFNVLAFSTLVVDSLIAGILAAVYLRQQRKQPTSGQNSLSLGCARLSNLISSTPG
jgi:hypothetical protein